MDMDMDMGPSAGAKRTNRERELQHSKHQKAEGDSIATNTGAGLQPLRARPQRPTASSAEPRKPLLYCDPHQHIGRREDPNTYCAWLRAPQGTV